MDYSWLSQENFRQCYRWPLHYCLRCCWSLNWDWSQSEWQKFKCYRGWEGQIRGRVVAYRRSSRSTGSLGTSVSNGTLKEHNIVSVSMRDPVADVVAIYFKWLHFLYFNGVWMYKFTNHRSSSASGSSRAGGTSISLSTILSSLSFSTRLSISTLYRMAEGRERDK